MYNLRKFNNMSDYQSFRVGLEYKPPCVSYITGSDIVKYGPIPQKAGDIAYWNGEKVKVCSYELWNDSIGTPVGVVVVPKGFAPDKKTRIVSLYDIDKNGNANIEDTNPIRMPFIINRSDMDNCLGEYGNVITTDNNGSVTFGFNHYGKLPDGRYPTYSPSYTDIKSGYYGVSNYTTLSPSPYVCQSEYEESVNLEYCKIVNDSNNKLNAFSDFDGLENTKKLVNISTNYIAANAAWNYNDNTSNLQWYLPSVGEAGCIAPRLNNIINTFTLLNKPFRHGNGYNRYTSTVNSFRKTPYGFELYYCEYSSSYSGQSEYIVRPFAKLP